MFVIGLTGGIGTGKTEVAALLRDLGAEVIDSDRLGHQAYAKGSPGWRRVVAEFGRRVLTPDGQVDRSALGDLVFSDRQALRRLNAIVHPLIRDKVEERLGELERGGAEVAVVEAPLFVEAGWTPIVDEVWVTVAPDDEVVRRVTSRGGLGPEAVEARVGSQMSQQERLEHAHVTIANDGSRERLREKVHALWRDRIPSSRKKRK